MRLSFDSVKHFLQPHSASKNILLGSLVLFLLFSIYLAGSWGITKVSVIQPRQLMLKWANNKTPFSEKKWQYALNKLHVAVIDNSNNAQHYFDLARLYDWAAYQKPIWNKDAIDYRDKAIENYKKSLELRPTWSSAWGNLAMSQTLNLKFGDEVKTALSHAMTYGAWEQGVFEQVLWVSLANWKALPAALQQQVVARITETVNSKGQVPKYIQQTATHFNWQEELKEVVGQKSLVGSQKDKHQGSESN